MDSTEFNKIAGAILGAFLVFLLLNFTANKIYGLGEGGHHGEEVLAYAVEVQETGGAPEPVEVDLVALIATADASKGAKLFGKCKGCHKLEDGKHGVGPSLWGIVGRDIGSVDFGFSGVLTELPGDWTLEALSAFLESPKKFAPGTKMSFGGISKPQDRVSLIVYLNEADGSPEPLE